jgi:uncharacterized protein YaaN involved in tellurite resistance
VAPAQAAELIRPDDEARRLVEQRAQAFADSVVRHVRDAKGQQGDLEAVRGLGAREVRAAAEQAAGALERLARSLAGLDREAAVFALLAELRGAVDSLYPAGDLLRPQKLFGLFRVGKPLRDYFLRYPAAQDRLARILEGLRRAQDELYRHHGAIEQEKVRLWEWMSRLRRHVALGQGVEAALQARGPELEAGAAPAARLVRQELLPLVGRRVQDLRERLALSMQSYLALDLARKHSLELAGGLELAAGGTVTALHAAVAASATLLARPLALERIAGLGEPPGGGDAAGVAPAAGREAAAAAALERLQSAFDDVRQALDRLAQYRDAAQDSLQHTVAALSGRIEDARADAPAPAAEDSGSPLDLP